MECYVFWNCLLVFRKRDCSYYKHVFIEYNSGVLLFPTSSILRYPTVVGYLRISDPVSFFLSGI